VVQVPHRRRWRPAVRFTAGDHELSGFELLFDVMAAFAFSQTDVLVLSDQTAEGALRGLLVLVMLWGCWMTYVWAANTADADEGTVRTTHIAALAGLVFLGMAMPRAFIEPGFNSRVMVFLAAYVLIRASSAFVLWVIHGHAAGRRPWVVLGASLATALLIGASTSMPASERIPFWLGGLTCETIAVLAFTYHWTVVAPGHLAERFGFIIIIGLDMSLGGMGRQMYGEPIGIEQLLLIGFALISCTVMWWLYFDLLRHYAEHRMHRAHPHHQRTAHHKLARTHYNLLHLIAMAGMVAFGLGLRTIADELRHLHAGHFGAPLTPLLATVLGGGLAVYTLAITVMWILLGRKSHAANFAVVVASLSAIPFLIGQPALWGPLVLGVIGLVLLAAEVMGRATRSERTTIKQELALKVHVPNAHDAAPASGTDNWHVRLAAVRRSNADVRHRHGNAALAAHLSGAGLDNHSFDRGFDLLDTHGVGAITWTDFTLLIHRVKTDRDMVDTDIGHRAERAYRHLWTAMCDAVDIDHDHLVTREEYIAYMTAVANDHPIDHRKDGRLTLIELAEKTLEQFQYAPRQAPGM